MADEVTISFKAPAELREALRQRCEADGMTQGQFLVDALRSALEGLPEKADELSDIELALGYPLR